MCFKIAIIIIIISYIQNRARVIPQDRAASYREKRDNVLQTKQGQRHKETIGAASYRESRVSTSHREDRGSVIQRKQGKRHTGKTGTTSHRQDKIQMNQH